LKLVPWGGGVALTREPAPERFDVALDMTGLKRVAIYDPDDYTITVECGITIDDLRATLAAKRQELPLEGAESWGATLGGVLAANASGPRRRALGAPRDRILGASFVTGDAVLAKSGGRVVKNVAGHAVHRLLVGSRGTLGVLVQASLKLLPQPPARAAMVWECDTATLGDAARWRDWPRREPAALTVVGRAIAAKNPVLATDASFTVIAGFEHDAAWVEDCAEFARRTLGAPRGEGERRERARDVAAALRLRGDAGAAAHVHDRREHARRDRVPRRPGPCPSGSCSTPRAAGCTCGRRRMKRPRW
jgi:glycolate oxidase FAD binding subunit